MLVLITNKTGSQPVSRPVEQIVDAKMCSKILFLAGEALDHISESRLNKNMKKT